MSDFPIVVTAAGAFPQAPQALRQQLVDVAVAEDPGLTTNLPASLIEDLASTGTGGLVVVDQACVDLVNSLTPYGANEALLIQEGNIYGVPQGTGANGSALIVVSSPNIGWAVPVGFTITDGSHQFVLQDGGIISADGTSAPLFAVSSVPGIFPIPANSITTPVTSIPPGITATFTNPEAGTPASTTETFEEYRARVVQAGLAASMGMTRYFKTIVGEVVGVQQRLISARLVTSESGERDWVLIVGGGDPYQVADAIFESIFDLTTVRGSTIGIVGITNGNPGIVQTDLNHGLVSGQNNVYINGVEGMVEANGGPYTVHVIDEKHFSFGVNTTLFGVYTSDGVVTPNARNVTVSVNDYPDVYNITYVNPPQQSVNIVVTWNTTAVNFVSDASVSQLGSQAVSAYVNTIPVGQPINLFLLEAAFMGAFQQATAGIAPVPALSRMVFAVSINGISVSVDAGTGLFEGDPESYFFMLASDVTVARG